MITGKQQDQKKIVVVCGITAFGKSVLCALIEKIRFSWIPIQDTLINEALSTKSSSDFSDVFLKQFYKMVIRSCDHPSRFDGTTFSGKTITDPIFSREVFESEWKALLLKRHSDFQSLYIESRAAALKSICFKKIDSCHAWHVVMPGAAHLFEKRYSELFDSCKFIYIDRGFESWINSRIAAEQRYYRKYDSKKDSGRKPKSVIRYTIRLQPNQFLQEYLNYYSHLEQTDSLIIRFDELFLENPNFLLEKIAKYLDVPFNPIDFRNAQYDLAGNLSPYERALAKFDDNKPYISNVTFALYRRIYKKRKVSKIDTLVGKVLFLIDYWRGRNWNNPEPEVKK